MLTFIKSVTTGMCLLGAVAVTTGWQAPPAGRLVFIGTYTGEKTGSKGIYAFRFNDASGALRPLGLKAETASPSFLATNATGRVLYAVNEVGNFAGGKAGSVSSFAVDPVSGALTPLGDPVSTQGEHPCHLQCDATGRTLAVANYSGGSFAVFPLGPDGRIGSTPTMLRGKGAGPNKARQSGPHGHQTVFDPSNRYMLAVDLGIDQVLVYKFDAASGRVTPNEPASVALPPGSGPRHLAFHPSGRFVFVINELGSTISTLSWTAATGVLAPLGSVSTLPAGFAGTSSTAEIAVHPNGRFVYGSNRGHDSIAVFTAAADGRLTPVEHEPTRGQAPRHFTLDPSGRWLIAANQNSNSLAVFSVDQSSGALTPSGPLAAVGGPVCVLFMP
jgi:6-phosphogluconolactonase